MTTLVATIGPQPVETIRTVLQRDVAAVLRDNMPALSMVPRDKVYDRLLDDPALLSQAFKLFRARPELFGAVLRTRADQLPDSDGDALWCGRTLAEVVALVVRACARRYFRRRKPTAVLARPAQRPGFLGRLFGAEPAQARRPVQVPAGERLFQAMRAVLLYDWQVPLIPAYSTLTAETATKLGGAILDYRRSDQVMVLNDPLAVAQILEGKTPLLMDGAKRLMIGDGSGVNAEVLWTLSQKMHLQVLFPEWEPNEIRRAVSVVSATSVTALDLLAQPFGDDVRAFALFLFAAYGKMGGQGFKQVFGPNGQLWVVRGLADRAMREPWRAPSLDQMKLSMERLLDGAVAA